MDPAASPAAEASEEEQREALLKLKSWYGEWSEMARAVIGRRDYLIRLGLAKRKVSKKKPGRRGPGEGDPKDEP